MSNWGGITAYPRWCPSISSNSGLANAFTDAMMAGGSIFTISYCCMCKELRLLWLDLLKDKKIVAL